MQKQHKMFMSPKKYPGGLRIFECETCRYAFAAEVGEHDIIRYDTKVTFNYGDLEAAHTIFQMPDEPLTLSMGSAIDQEKNFPA